MKSKYLGEKLEYTSNHSCVTTDLDGEPGHGEHHGDGDQHLCDPPPVPLRLLAHRAAPPLRLSC